MVVEKVRMGAEVAHQEERAREVGDSGGKSGGGGRGGKERAYGGVCRGHVPLRTEFKYVYQILENPSFSTHSTGLSGNSK